LGKISKDTSGFGDQRNFLLLAEMKKKPIYFFVRLQFLSMSSFSIPVFVVCPHLAFLPLLARGGAQSEY
jgi:hypothetical protein